MNAFDPNKPKGEPVVAAVGQLLPNEQDLARFIAAVFKRADPNGVVSLRAFPDAVKNARPLFIEPISLGDPQFLPVVIERARQAANWAKPAVFCPPVVTLKDGRNAKADNVHEGVTLPVECDEKPNSALSVLREILGDPTVIVASGGEWTNPGTGEVEEKVHAHWGLKVPTRTPQEHAKLREARDLAAKLVGADATAVPLVHPLRWPGSWHRKNAPRLAKITFESENEIDLAEALELLREAAGAQVISDQGLSSGGIDLNKKKNLRADHIEDVVAALKVIPNKDLEWRDWNDIGMATWNASGASEAEAGKAAFHEWSAKSKKYDQATTEARWDHYGEFPPTRIGMGTLIYKARNHNPLWMPPSRTAPAAGETAAATKSCIVATPYDWTDPEKIPPREFLYGKRLIRKYTTATIAPGGVGKTALEVAEVLSMVSGKALLGVQTPQLRVWLWSLEDPREEMQRRIQGAAKHYSLTADDIGDRLFVDSGREQPLVIAEAVRNGFVICRPVVEAIIAQLKERAVDVLIIDPFVSSHRVTENDNGAIDAVTKAWAYVADAANCAVELVHHVRKGEQEITVESARGGGSFGDACRMVRVINRMTKEEAEKAGVDNHRLHFRTYIDKNNLAPPAEASDWYKLVSVDLCNGPLGPAVGGGDSIGVVTKWHWPDPVERVTGGDVERVAAAIRAGNWRADQQAAHWVGKAIASAMGLDLDERADKAKVKQLLKHWLKTGVLVEVDGETDKREIKRFIRVADTVKAASAQAAPAAPAAEPQF
jgi:hypothetical protein